MQSCLQPVARMQTGKDTGYRSPRLRNQNVCTSHRMNYHNSSSLLSCKSSVSRIPNPQPAPLTIISISPFVLLSRTASSAFDPSCANALRALSIMLIFFGFGFASAEEEDPRPSAASGFLGTTGGGARERAFSLAVDEAVGRVSAGKS